MSKGTRRERQAGELLEQAGYWTYRPDGNRHRDNDMWEIFDVGGIRPGELYLAQVKAVGANTGLSTSISRWFRTAALHNRLRDVTVAFMCCHDHAGWRLAEPSTDGYEWVVDERDADCAMGERVVEYLSGDNTG